MSRCRYGPEVVTYPGARRPDRHRQVDVHGLRLAVSEWGDADGPPLLLAHGGFDVADHERARLLVPEVRAWLDHRAKASTKVRRPGTLEELAERRAKMNPRLPLDWLRYLVPIGAREDADGWRWKIDPMLRMGGFG